MPDDENPTSARLTIGQLAASAGVKRSTLRYYEREGLLKPAGRSAHGYRHYDDESRERLSFIRAGQSAGFSLGDIQALLRLRDRDALPCDNVRDLIDARLDDVNRQLGELRHVRQVLLNARRDCVEGEPRQACAVLDRLSGDDASSA